MDQERWRRIERLFAEASEMEPEPRSEYLARVCADDEALRQELERLLRHDTGSVDRLASPISEEARAATEPRRESIGPYKVVREIGRGGMGAVYLASRADDEYRKDVAIKLVPGVPDSRELLQRFRSERQILATLEHPNIARLLDGGATEDGLPYLVMEYVEGEPIDRYCDRNHLSVEQRLRLFLDVCAAVQHAHRNLIVHRDLKPGNILVKSDGTVKLLDFGIAKLLDPSDAAHSVAVTDTAQRLMTPEYASPEQVRGETIGTFTDVYSLGVLLYELLAGCRPYRIEGRKLGDIERAICEQQPERPSTAGPAAWRKRLAGDLDDIVMMALRKEPERRYPSVELMAQDVKRHLDQMPVSARPDTWSYRSGKFVRRHRWSLALAALVILMISGFGVTMAFQARRIAHERDTAEQVTQFLVRMFEIADPHEGRADELTAREILDTATERIRAELLDQPEVRERLMGTLGDVNLSLGEYSAAVPLLEERLELSRNVHGDESLETAWALNRLSVSHWNIGEYDEAGTLVDRALEIYREHLDPDDPLALDAVFNAVLVRIDTERFDEAEQLLHEAYRVAKTSLPDPHESTEQALHLLAVVLVKQNRFEEALDYQEQSLAMSKALYGADAVDVATAYHNLAATYIEIGDNTKATDAATEALRIRRLHLPEIHPEIAVTLSMLGKLARSAGEPEKGVELAEESVRIFRAVHEGRVHRQTASALNNLALALGDVGRSDETMPIYEEIIAIRKEIFGEDHRLVGWAYNNLGWSLYLQRKCAEATLYFTRAMEIIASPEHPDPFGSVAIKNLGVALACDGRLERAERALREAIVFGREHLPPNHSFLAVQVMALGTFLMNSGRLDEAEPVLREAVELCQARLPEGHWSISTTQSELGDCLMRLGRHEESESVLLAAYGYENREAKAKAAERLVELYEKTGRAGEADRYRER